MGFESRNNKFYMKMMLPAIVFLAALVVYPIVYNFRLSLQDATLRTIRLPEMPFVGLGNYASVLSNPLFPVSMARTLVFTAGSIFFQFVIGFALALFLFRQFPLNKFVRTTIIMGWVLAPIIVGTVWSWLLNTDHGLINYLLKTAGIIGQGIGWLTDPNIAMRGVIIANVWFGIPFNMLLLTGGLSALPTDVYEAADIDGTSPLQKFFFITLPLMKPTIGAVLMLGTIYTLRVFDLLWVMTKGGPVNATTTLPLWSYQLSFDFFNLGEGAAASNILFVIMIVFTLLYIKFFSEEGWDA
jgi:multiple sugar transport system permease protein